MNLPLSLRCDVSIAVGLSTLVAHHDPEAAAELRAQLLVVIGGPEHLESFSREGSLSCRAILWDIVEACKRVSRDLPACETDEDEVRLEALTCAVVALDRLVTSFDPPPPAPSSHVEAKVNVRTTGVA